MAEIEKSLVLFNEWGFFLPLINPILAQSLELSAKRRDESLKAQSNEMKSPLKQSLSTLVKHSEIFYPLLVSLFIHPNFFMREET